MVERAGIGATLVAAVAFSIILASGLAVFVASQGLAEDTSMANSESYLSSEYLLLEGAEGAGILSALQQQVSSAPVLCASPYAALDLATMQSRQAVANLTVSSSASIAPGAALGDNLSVLRPYEGSVPGELDLELRFVASGSAGPGVWFYRTETHYAHLPVDISLAASICLGSAEAMGRALADRVAHNCTRAFIDPILTGASLSFSSRAKAAGLTFGYTYSVDGTDGCSVAFQVRVGQEGVEGPGGPFNVLLEESGSAVVATPAQTPGG